MSKSVAPCAVVFADWASSLSSSEVPDAVRRTLQRLLLDAGGLMVSARDTDYVRALIAARDGTGTSTAVGHSQTFTRSDAAMIAGTSIHGEDFDDTFEGTPVHVGAAVVPAVLVAAESEKRSGADVLRGLAVGGELMCRMAVVAPTAIHRAGFHPTAVIGAMGAAAAVATTLGLNSKQTAAALGIAGSMASGIIEYLAEGTSTKRLHPGWAASAGIRAATLARAGFTGPPTVFDGTHGFFHAFADHSIEPDLTRITESLGQLWSIEGLAFKPYACGTMVQPFIDCAIKLRSEFDSFDDVKRIRAAVGEGTVHRLWESRAEKARPSTPYSAKFSGPWGIAIGLARGQAGLDEFSQQSIADPEVLALAAKVDYEIDPDNEYPQNYSGQIDIELKDGRSLSAVQPCLRGGRQAPMTDEELQAKFFANAHYGGWSQSLAQQWAHCCLELFSRDETDEFAQFRQ